MKRALAFLLTVILCVSLLPAASVKTKAAATDKFLETFFPDGKITTPDAPYIQVCDEGSWSTFTAWIDQTADIKNVAKSANDMLAEDKDFSEKYGLYYGFKKGYQMDISIDDDAWKYNSDWDRCDYDSIKNKPDYYGYYFDLAASDTNQDNYYTSTLADSYYLVETPGFFKQVLTKVKDEYGETCYLIDTKNHNFKFRVRQYVSYVLDETGEEKYIFSDWSKTVSIGKGGTQKDLKTPDKLTAPTLSDPYRSIGKNGKWDGCTNYNITFPKAVSDEEKALVINLNAFEPLYLQAEIAVNDLTEKNFEKIYTANPEWISNGTRATAQIENIKYNDNQRVLLRAYVIAGEYDLKSAYAYAVPQVTGLKAKTTKTTSITLSWNKLKEAEFYEIYDDKNNLLGTSETNSFTVKDLTAGKGYNFKVRAVVDKVYVGLFSSVLKTPTKPSTVTLSSAASPQTKTVSATWKTVKNGTGYQIYAATDKNFKKNLQKIKVTGIGSSTEKIAKLTSGKTYYVKVRAYVTYGGKTVYGAWSKAKTIKCK